MWIQHLTANSLEVQALFIIDKVPDNPVSNKSKPLALD